MLVTLGLAALLGQLPQHLWFSLVTMVVALGLITAGLLSSTFHLGHPERAWRAFSQWRSSWLSREGIMAVATYMPALGFGLAWAFPNLITVPLGIVGVGAALFALGTIYTTAMIYRSLKPIHQWHNKHVVGCYLVLGVMTGAVFVLALSSLFGQRIVYLTPICGLLLAAGLSVKWLYWAFIDSTTASSTPASAVGLSGPNVKVTSVVSGGAQTRHAAQADRDLGRVFTASNCPGNLDSAASGFRNLADHPRSAGHGHWHRGRALAVLRPGQAYGDALLWGRYSLTLWGHQRLRAFVAVQYSD